MIAESDRRTRGDSGVRSSALLALILLLASGCARPSSAPPAAPAPATPARPGDTPAATAPRDAPQDLTHLTLAYSTASAANSPLQLAQDRGIFRANGLDVDLIHAPGNTGPAAVLAGQAQMLSSGCTEAVGAIAGGADFVVVLTSINRLQYELVGGPSVTNVDALRGKRLAVSRIGSSSHLALRFIVKYLGLDPDQDVSYVQVGNTPERVSALLAGSVDASILSSDEATLIGNQPGMHTIVDMTTEDQPYCGNALVMTRQYTRDAPDVGRRLTRALVEALARFRQSKAEGTDAIARFLNDDDLDKAAQLWETWVRLFPEKPYPDPRGLQFVLDELAQTDPRAKALTPDQLIDATWVRELDQSGFLDSLYRSANR
ncbi:MAG TPA: ABC transporter substrate-binding protein [Chloroflexota bacterium]|nr:ABC transporter substrate-binding protein [Chloroflexota bacterium]